MTTASDARAFDLTDPAAVAAAVVALARADRDGFLSSVAGDRPLMDGIAAHHNADATWLMNLAGEIRGSGVRQKDVDQLLAAVKRMARDRVRAARPTAARFRVIEADAAQPLVSESLPTAPVTPDAVVPAGYQLSSTRGIVALSESDEGIAQTVVAGQPVVVAGLLQDTGTDTQRMRLAWLDIHGWRQITVGREIALNRTELVRQAAYGFPSNSDNAAALVRYIQSYENANRPILPRMSVSGHLGWQHGDDPAFLWGASLLTGDGAETAGIDPEAAAPADWREDWIGFNPAGDGDRQAAAGFRAAGSLDGWHAAIAPVAGFDRVRFVLYASLAAPLLHVLNAGSFWVDIASPTSRGKTTAAQVAASVWGCPETDVPTSVIANWNSTKVYIERRASLCNGLPLIVDETKQANAKTVAEIVYMVANGQGRGRGQKDAGVRASSSWRTVGISTGEQPLTAFSQDGGTRARTLTLWGDPWGATSEETGITVSKIKNLLPNHYGHAGPRFVAWLLANRARWEEWQAAYEAEVGEYIVRHHGHPVVSRIARYVAAIGMAAALADEAGILPWEYRDPIAPVWAALLAEAGEADRAAEALRMVYGWAIGQQDHFDGQFKTDRDHNEILPSTGAIGRWQPHDDYIGFLPHRLRDFLKDAGFDPEGIIRTWADAGWLRLDQNGGRGVRATRVFKVQGKNTRGYVVPLATFTDVVGLDEDRGIVG